MGVWKCGERRWERKKGAKCPVVFWTWYIFFIFCTMFISAKSRGNRPNHGTCRLHINTSVRDQHFGHLWCAITSPSHVATRVAFDFTFYLHHGPHLGGSHICIVDRLLFDIKLYYWHVFLLGKRHNFTPPNISYESLISRGYMWSCLVTFLSWIA